MGYDEGDLEQHRRGPHGEPTDEDMRTPFQHDVDRILYSSEFRALAGKTQVVAADQLGGYHNRLTHSLKVAQIGRRLAVQLTRRAGDDVVGPDPDLLEAACLLHDIGHPPFGHIGEESLGQCVDELYNCKPTRSESWTPRKRNKWPDPPSDGFQGNAQNLRIATYLSARATRDQRGLHLTRATLDAATKYPWRRGPKDHEYSHKHWGCYESEVETTKWILRSEDAQQPPPTKDAADPRPVEEQIMDWADEVTYACHDVEDFYRAGLIPLDRILALPYRADSRRAVQDPYETEQFLNWLEDAARRAERTFDRDRSREHLREIQNLLLQPVYPYEGDYNSKQATATATSRLISHFVTGIELRPAGQAGGPLTRYGATLHVPDDRKEKADLLNNLIRFYVIDRPGLAGQQRGQQRIVADLTSWVAHEPKRLLPPDRLEEFREHADPIRSAADYVASMTEGQALMLHLRMSGVDYGQITDIL